MPFPHTTLLSKDLQKVHKATSVRKALFPPPLNPATSSSRVTKKLSPPSEYFHFYWFEMGNQVNTVWKTLNF